VQLFYFDELKKEFKKHPKQYSDDLKYMVKRWHHLFKKVKKNKTRS